MNPLDAPRKVLIVATVSMTVKAFLIPFIKELQSLGYNVEVAANFLAEENAGKKQDELVHVLEHMYVACHQIDFTRNQKLISSHLRAYMQLKVLLADNCYDFVHTNTPIASSISRLACARTNTTCIYTAHGFHFYKGAPLLNWFIWYPIEKGLSYLTDIIFTINQEDFELAVSKMHSSDVKYLPGVGVDVARFSSSLSKTDAREKYGITQDAFVLLSVGELNNNKNHEVIIRSLSSLCNDDSLPRIDYVVAGEGINRIALEDLASNLGISDHVHLIGWQSDIPELMSLADVYVHPSLREGLPVSVMEAMAACLPVVASDIRGNRDLVNSKNGILVHENSPSDYFKAIKSLVKMPVDQRNLMGKAGLKVILDHFETNVVLEQYSSELKNFLNIERR